MFGKTRSGERRPQLRPVRGQPEQPRRGFSSYEGAVADQIPIPVPALVSEDRRRSNLGWNRDGRIVVEQRQPLPCTILALTGQLEVST